MSAPHPLAVRVCASSSEHASGRGRHDAHRYGPCSDHARIVAEVLALRPDTDLRDRIAAVVEPAWRTNEGYRFDDTTTAYAAGRNSILDEVRAVLGAGSHPDEAAHLDVATEPDTPKDA